MYKVWGALGYIPREAAGNTSETVSITTQPNILQ